MKWIVFFFLSFAGIFTGLMFATGIAQKQVIPLVQKRFSAATGVATGAKKEAPADSSAAAAKPAADSVSAAPRTAAKADSSAAPQADAAAQQQAVNRAVPQARTPEQQVRDALIAKVYAEMKPEDAAKILGRLDDPTALAILSHFKAPAAARLLEAMGPERSVRMTQMWASGALAEGGAP